MPTVPTHKRNTSSIRSIPKLQAFTTITERPQTSRTTATTLNAKEKEAIQLFTTNLKLLGLNKQPDWPNITPAIFANHDSRARIRMAEWSLFHLFRLYDRQMTSDKLQPFFPPLEPLQSVNLRAALYRCLNEMKKNGALGRETTLRKTMLDECSGEKFWELCLAFSGTVLRKVTAEYRGDRGQPIAQKLASAQVLGMRDRESLLPLAVAHKSALSRVLSQKQVRRQNFGRLADSLKDKEQELVRRKHAIDAQAPVVESAEHAAELSEIEKELNGSWTTDRSFKDAIVNGDPARPGDHMLLQPTDEFLASIDQQDQQESRRDSGVIEDIELQARAQNARVKEWQALFVRIQGDKTNSTTSKGTKPNDLRFDRHHDMGVDDLQPEPVKSTIQPEPIPSYVSRYDEILTSMREELRRAQTARREAQSKRPAPIRQPSITLDAIARAPQLPPTRSNSRRSISPSFPLGPDMLKRASSRTRSYQQPKVISQREHIPLKSEILSPLKRTGSASPASGRSSIIGSPLVEDSTAIDSLVHNSTTKRESASSLNTPETDSGIGLGVHLTESPIADETVKKPLRSVSFAHRQSLSERTRKSISLSRLEDDQADLETSSQGQQTPPQSEASGGLAARTRQSMAGILPIRTSASFSHSRASSVANSFAPTKQRTIVRQTSRSFSEMSTLEPTSANEQTRRNITPREKLFEADAEYNSVFKSRPKIAASPPLTPVLGNEENDPMMDA